MNIIILKKATVVAAPVPPFVGTRLSIEIKDDQLTYGFNSATLAEGCAALTVDWGDGVRERIVEPRQVAHTYERPGEYEVRLSDDLASFAASANSSTSPFLDVYPKCLKRVVCNAQRLEELRTNAFVRSLNLEGFDLRESAIRVIRNIAFFNCTKLRTTAGLPAGLEELMSNAFKGCSALTEVGDLPHGLTALPAGCFVDCAALSGRIDLPCIAGLVGSKNNEPFSGCTGGITEFHFAKANEAAICGTQAYGDDPTLGTGTASCKFDL